MNRLVMVGCLLLGCAEAQAGAWLQPEGEGQVIATASGYATGYFFNSGGERVSQTNRFRKNEINIYAEYGLSDAYTVGLQPSYQWVRVRGPGGRVSERGLADTALFLRERLWHSDRSVFSLQQLVTIPGPYDVRNAASLGYGQSDLELRALLGHSGDIAAVPYFIDVQGAYRKRFEEPADEVRLDLTFGLKPTRKWMVLAQSFDTFGMGNESGATFVTVSGPDYDLVKLQLSGVREIDENLSLQFGGALDVHGRNTGGGTTLFLGVWRKF